MKLHSEIVDGVALLYLTGELDTRGNQQLDKKLKELTVDNYYNIVIDLTTIRFVGSQTVSLIISNLKEIRAGGGDIRFLNPQRSVTQYLKQNRIFEIFKIFSTKAEALQSFGSGQNAPAKPPERGAVSPPSGAPSASGSPLRRETPDANPPAPPDSLKQLFHANEMLYANSCILATLVKTLEGKGVLSSSEAGELLSYDMVPKSEG